MSESLTITIVSAESGQSESVPVASTTTIQELLGFAKALLGFDGDDDDNNITLLKDGKKLSPLSASLQDAGVKDGDLIAAAQHPQLAAPAVSGPSSAATTASTAAGGGGGSGLDFSSLLAQGGGGPAAAAPHATSNQPPAPTYYPGMNLNEAIAYNPHPQSFITLLQSKEHLMKELNYHNPRLAAKLKDQPYERAVDIWREEVVKGSIQNAFRTSTSFHKEQEMTRRIQSNPNDTDAKEYFSKKQQRRKVDQQYQQMMQEYPESLGRVLMLYIAAKINGHEVQPFVDSGAQATIMSKKVATECGLLDLIDTRFEGMAVGVGTGKILGRIHIVQLQIGSYHFPCSVTVMDDPSTSGGSEMPFLLGLDMMKRHLCQIDLEKGVLKFRLGPGQYMETPFLHEKDLDESKGGTKGFDAEKANQKLLEELEKNKRDEDDMDDE